MLGGNLMRSRGWMTIALLCLAPVLFLGLDRMYRAHRSLGLVAVGLVVLHTLLLVLSQALRSGASPRRTS